MFRRISQVSWLFVVVGTLWLAGCQTIAIPLPATPPATPSLAATVQARSQEVTFPSGELTLPGTLSLPPGPGPHPALITLTGSGAEDRDNGGSTVPGYRPFAQIGQRLQAQGVAVLRFEDRRMVDPTGTGASATAADLLLDAEAALTYLQGRDDVDADQIGVLGHSLGATVAAMLAADHPDEIDFVVSLAGPALNGYDTVTSAYGYLPEAMGMPEEQVAEMAEAETMAMDLALAKAWDELEVHLVEATLAQLEGLSEAQKASLGDLEAFARQQAKVAIQRYRDPRFHFEMTYDPAEAWARVQAPVLALFAEYEATIFAEAHQPALTAVLDTTGNSDVTVEVVSGVNHLFLEAESGNPQHWPSLFPEVPERVINRINDWILTHVEPVYQPKPEDMQIAAPSPSSSAEVSERVRQWQENLDFLLAELPKRHVAPFFQTSQEAFETEAAALRAAIPDLNDAEIYARMAQLVALLGDEHTAIARNNPDALYYPYNVRIFDDGIYIYVTAPAYAEILGARLVQIGETDANTVLERIATTVAHANPQWVRVQTRNLINSVDLLYGLGVVPDRGVQSFTFERADGERFTLTIEPVDLNQVRQIDWQIALDADDYPLALQSRPPGNYWYEHLEDSDTVYLKYNVCADADGMPFADFVEQLFVDIESRPVDKFVVDLRHNRGGNSAVMAPLLAALQAHPEINQQGRLFAIIGRDTFSSGLLNAIELAQQTEAILVGEATGGKPNHYGEVRTFALPHFGIVVAYSTNYFEYVEGDPSSLAPKIAVELTAEDFFAGRDPFLAAVLKE